AATTAATGVPSVAMTAATGVPSVAMIAATGAMIAAATARPGIRSGPSGGVPATRDITTTTAGTAGSGRRSTVTGRRRATFTHVATGTWWGMSATACRRRTTPAITTWITATTTCRGRRVATSGCGWTATWCWWR